MQIGLVLVAVLISAVVLLLALQVDDWGRDLTTNVAETSDQSDDPDLRPLVAAVSMNELVETVKRVATALPDWTLEAEESGQQEIVLRFTRTTRLFRFKDDIAVRVVDRGSERVLAAKSRSRIGKGDLGQNPRNLKQLLEAVRTKLEAL
jgi:uncharacterized protein (DUF1499 family)